ncbi:hypothetical protein CUMW_244120, partial [Citrus unshiu]
VLLLTALGLFLALDRIDILGDLARQHLNKIGAIYMWSYVYNIVWIYSSCTNSEGEKLDNSTENITPMEETTEKLSNSHMKPLLPLNGCSAIKDHLNHFDHDCSITARKPQVG